MKVAPIIFFLLFSFLSESQRTVGTIFTTDAALDGYLFFSPFSSTNAYMVDNCGRLVNQWNRGTRPGLAAYFLDNGLMMRTYKVNPIGPFTSASNAGGLELVDWDNITVWSYEFNTETLLSHHDAVMMPNGNILVLLWELVFSDELISLGRDPNEIAPQGFAWNEKIQEIKPIGNDEIEVVWEWKIKDHYIQDFDSAQSNFGVVSEHPELFDINLPELDSPNSHSDLDYNHFNAIDYNETLDQILISVRNSDEIWIIDHSTTTEEAATHSGGKYGKGGDILYRWGNASAYQRASIEDEVLYGQHGAHWIKEGVDAGKILIFNNGNGRPGTDYSVIEVLQADQASDGSYAVDPTLPFGPTSAEWRYGEDESERFFSAFLSNAQRLPNGNTLINSGSPGNIFEVTPEKEIVWEYEIPLNGNNPAPQGFNIFNNSTFRAYKFLTSYAGFDGIDIEIGEPIESDPNPLTDCDLTSVLSTKSLESDLKIYSYCSQLEFENTSNHTAIGLLYNLQGKLIEQFDIPLGMSSAPLESNVSGLYVCVLINEENKTIRKIFIY